MFLHHRQIIFRALLIEGGLIPIALVWAAIQKMSWQQRLVPVWSSFWIGGIAGLALVGGNYVLIEYGARYWSFFRQMKVLLEHDVAPLFRNLPIWWIVALALCSGIAEEFFFRGVMQAQLGLIAASLIFGLAHVWQKRAIPYGIYAAVIGGFFGGLYVLTQNLWTPILAHIVNNFLAILYCRQSCNATPDQKMDPVNPGGGIL